MKNILKATHKLNFIVSSINSIFTGIPMYTYKHQCSLFHTCISHMELTELNFLTVGNTSFYQAHLIQTR